MQGGFFMHVIYRPPRITIEPITQTKHTSLQKECCRINVSDIMPRGNEHTPKLYHINKNNGRQAPKGHICSSYR